MTTQIRPALRAPASPSDGVATRRAVVVFLDDNDGARVHALATQAYDHLASVEEAAALGPVNVIGIGAGASAALAAASGSGNPVGRLVLLSPRIGDNSDLGSISAPTLVAVGSDDTLGAADARRCYDEMESCYLTIVYAAGRDVAADRPEATAALIENFLEAGETFPVRTATHRLYP